MSNFVGSLGRAAVVIGALLFAVFYVAARTIAEVLWYPVECLWDKTERFFTKLHQG